MNTECVVVYSSIYVLNWYCSRYITFWLNSYFYVLFNQCYMFHGCFNYLPAPSCGNSSPQSSNALWSMCSSYTKANPQDSRYIDSCSLSFSLDIHIHNSCPLSFSSIYIIDCFCELSLPPSCTHYKHVLDHSLSWTLHI